MNRSRRAGLLATIAVAALLLTGCVSAFKPSAAPSTSTPTHEKVAADLTKYYRQIVHWSTCHSTFQCATVTAPLNWSDPTGTTLKLALVRQVAKGTSLGSLLVNPGGPGASAVDFVDGDINFAVDSTLQQHYDIVAFDPPGVGHTQPISCAASGAGLDKFFLGIVPGTPGSTEWLNAEAKENAELGASCLKYSGELLGNVDTKTAARDMDLVRAVLGDTKLHYLGYSYGTYLGQVYATLYPKRVGRMVLDGVLNTSSSQFDIILGQAKAFGAEYRAYLKQCIGKKGCAFSGSVDDAVAETEALLQSLDRSPLQGQGDFELNGSALQTALTELLYQPTTWQYISPMLEQVVQGKTQLALAVFDEYFDRTAGGTYTSNLIQAFIAVSCLDYPDPTPDPATVASDAKKIIAAAPLFGPNMSYVGCPGWPVTTNTVPRVTTAPGSGPILVLGSTGDPATPYAGAVALAKSLDNGHLVTYHGEGHTAYNKSNSCVNDAVDDYFVKGTVPKRDPEC